MELNRAIKIRRSIRRFSDKKPNWRDIIECIDACRYAPMAGGNFSLKFIIVDDKEKIQKLADASEQNFVGTAQYIVVVCSAASRTLNAYAERGKKYQHQQAGAAIQNFLLKIQEKGLATCWVGHFDEEKVKRVLKIPRESELEIEAIFPVGHSSVKTKAKHTIEMDSILFFNEYRQKRMKPLGKMEV